METKEKNAIECFKCAYYFVTWDKNHPRGCRYFGFKGSRTPSLVVRQSSGEDCKMFTPKGMKKGAMG